MKKTILLLSAILFFFVSCKKDVEPEASKVEIVEEKIEKGWDYIKINVEYDYPVELEAVILYLSEKEDMSGAEAYECNLEGKKFSVEVEGLKDGNICYYCYEYDNGYEKERGDAGGLMIITTRDINIGFTTATCGGGIKYYGDDEITSRGVCWSTSPNPTINDNKTTDGSGTGSYTSNLSNLTPNTTYYVRAYATNEKGTAYGAQKSFTTLEFKNETITVNGVSFTMIAVEGGTFQMGATSEQGSDAYSDESPVHSVTLSDYYIGETEVTQELWEAVMGSNPSYFSGYPQRPVEDVSWYDCQTFISKLNELTGKNFRFPTEAEWEYAARGGNKSKGYKYSGSNTIGNVAWYKVNSGSETHDVKTKQANELGIYDMSGNVYEWCQDWRGIYSSDSQTNPTGPTSGSSRVLRGGSWLNYDARECRVSYRQFNHPDTRISCYGFRLILQ